jgi:hypothetical protein
LIPVVPSPTGKSENSYSSFGFDSFMKMNYRSDYYGFKIFSINVLFLKRVA